MDLGKVLKSYRNFMGLTQPELVCMIKSIDQGFRCLDVVSYHRWESNKVTPNVEKQSLILSSFGLVKCAQTLSSDKGTEINNYIDKKFGHSHFPEYVFGKSNVHKESERWTALKGEVIPNFIYTFQQTAYGNSNSSSQFRTLTSKAVNSALEVYFSSTKPNQITGHLIYFHLRQNCFGELLSQINGKVTTHLELKAIKSDVLFIACYFASSKQIFTNQLLKLINYLYSTPAIKHVYFRSYDPILTTSLIKATSCQVLSKTNQWTGLLIGSTKLKFLYANLVKVPPQCFKKNSCDVRKCYASTV
ncbi:hypothetical protein ACPV5R_20205 [Vibrio astriarenae]